MHENIDQHVHNNGQQIPQQVRDGYNDIYGFGDRFSQEAPFINCSIEGAYGNTTNNTAVESTDESLNMMNKASEGPRIKIRARQHHPQRTLPHLGDQGIAPRRIRLNLGPEERQLMHTGNEAVQVVVSEARISCLAFLIDVEEA